MFTIGTFIKALYIGRLRRILKSRLCQKIPFEDEFNFIEAKCWGVNEHIHFRILIRNLDKDVIQMLTIHIRILFAAELGNHIQEICEIALWKRTHYHLVDGWLRF
jgi:hypothetical protein